MEKIFLLFVTFNLSQNIFCQTSSINSIRSNIQWAIEKYLWGSENYNQENNNHKPIIDFNTIDNWEELGDDGDVSISPNGDYFSYSTKKNYVKTFFVQSTKNEWKIKLGNVDRGFFSDDNRNYFFKKGDDLYFVNIGGDGTIQSIKGAASFRSPVVDGKYDSGTWIAWQDKKSSKLILKNLVSGFEEDFDSVASFDFHISRKWICLQKKTAEKTLVLFNLESKKQLSFKDVFSYSLDNGGKVLLIESDGQLLYNDLEDDFSEVIWTAQNKFSSVVSYTMDASSSRVALILKNVDGNSVCYWQKGMGEPVEKLSDRNAIVVPEYTIQGAGFIADNYLLVKLQQRLKTFKPEDTKGIKIDVWDYRDTILQSTQPYLKEEAKSYEAIVNIKSSTVFRLERPFETRKGIGGDYVIISKPGNVINGDRFWEKGYDQDTNWIVSLKDGKHILLKTKTRDDIWLSRDGRYVIYFDQSGLGNYFSYNIVAKRLMNISACSPTGYFGIENRFASGFGKECGLAGWLEGGELLVYDNYDIWKLDPTGKEVPANITNGYGRRHNIKFMLAGYGEFGQVGGATASFSFTENCPLILRAFNTVNKENGIYRMVLGVSGDPKCLTMGPFSMRLIPISTINVAQDNNRRKAKDTNLWIVERESPVQSPNYYLTSDFKSYKPLTNLQPQKSFNWQTATLHRFKQQDGRMSDGILYKPENFDPQKKYPIVIAIYSFPSMRMNEFRKPQVFTNPVHILDNPAWMVSQGYLVFTPDIYFKEGLRGKSAFNTVEGAVDYLKTLPYVDGNKIGLVGHSASGHLAYYILTHSHSFAAVSIGSGVTNSISNALSLDPAGYGWTETSRLKDPEQEMGNIWNNKSLWLAESPIMNVDKVVSPYLMFHNKMDAVPNDGVEMFIALRRMEKRGWWFRYDHGGHVVRGDDAKDFTIRYTQFFDHYLKNAPAPRWMTEGIPYKLKGIDAKYELDPRGTCGMKNKPCIICDAWNKQYKRNPAMFDKPIGEWKLDEDIQKELEKQQKEERARFDRSGSRKVEATSSKRQTGDGK